MQLTAVPTEQTTAATDLVLAGLSFGCALALLPLRRADGWQVGLWASAFGLLGVASLLGTAVHGLTMSPSATWLLWQPLHLSLGLVVGLFVAGALHDLAGRRPSRLALPG